MLHASVEEEVNVDMREAPKGEHGHAKMTPCAEYVRQVFSADAQAMHRQFTREDVQRNVEAVLYGIG